MIAYTDYLQLPNKIIFESLHKLYEISNSQSR